jgi:hypothetical protein
MAKEAKRSRGRPPKPSEARKRNVLTIRVRDRLKADLEAAAAENQRSLSEEAEFRLEWALRTDKLLSQALEIAYGRELAGLVRAMARPMKEAGTMAGVHAVRAPEDWREWWKNPYAYDEFVRAAVCVLEAFRPQGEIIPPGALTNALGGVHLGEGFANSILGAIAGDGPTQSLQDEGAEIRELLGSLANRLRKN